MRVQGHIFTQETHPCGTLVVLDGIDGGEKVLHFIVPSKTRRNRVYGCEVSLRTGEAACGCEAMSRTTEDHDGFREAFRMPYRFDAAAAPVEVLAKAKGIPMAPMLTRAPRNMCGHLRKVRAAIRRRGLWQLILDAEAWATARIDAAPEKARKAS